MRNNNSSDKLSIVLENNDIVNSDIDKLLNNISGKHLNELENLLLDINIETIRTKVFINEEKEKETVSEEIVLYEDGTLMDLKIGHSGIKEVERYFQTKNTNLIVNKNINIYSSLYFYKDLDIAICFDSNDIIREITLGKNFRGRTGRGLRINQQAEQAIRYYGFPEKVVNTKNIIFYSWQNLTLFCEKNLITHIRYRKISP